MDDGFWNWIFNNPTVDVPVSEDYTPFNDSPDTYREGAAPDEFRTDAVLSDGDEDTAESLPDSDSEPFSEKISPYASPSPNFSSRSYISPYEDPSSDPVSAVDSCCTADPVRSYEAAASSFSDSSSFPYYDLSTASSSFSDSSYTSYSDHGSFFSIDRSHFFFSLVILLIILVLLRRRKHNE